MKYTLHNARVELNLNTGGFEVFTNERITLVGTIKDDYILQLWKHRRLDKRITKDGIEEVDSTKNKTTFIND
jgi:hypothetical protein